MLSRAAIKAAIILVLGYGFARGVLALFADLDWSALTGTEQLVIVSVIGMPLLALAALSLAKGWRLHARHVYFADLGFRADVAGVQRRNDLWFVAHAGMFESADGSKRPAWIVNAQATDHGHPDVLYDAKDAPGEGGARELDDDTRTKLEGLTDLVQLRVTPKLIRIVLERSTPVDAVAEAGPPPMVEVPCAAVVATITTTPSSFSPTQVTVSRGQVVRFEPSTPHDATSGTPGEPLPWFAVYGGDPRCLRFDEPGTFPFFCQVHPTMSGRLIVEP